MLSSEIILRIVIFCPEILPQSYLSLVCEKNQLLLNNHNLETIHV